ncbi:hypothetical protein OIO90_006576 [Microbotryomycetes sp. JL221]|nr:hypothetical protein OIO90_006576 [Microbotryomycetes sp. JL221]
MTRPTPARSVPQPHRTSKTAIAIRVPGTYLCSIVRRPSKSCQRCPSGQDFLENGCPCYLSDAQYWVNRCPAPGLGSVPAGSRIMIRNSQIGDVSRFGPSFNGAGTPTYVVSTLIGGGVHPGMLRDGVASASYGGATQTTADFDVLPLTDQMEWVDASKGDIPAGRRGIVGGYESSGATLYHAIAQFNNVWVGGKSGYTFLGAAFPQNGGEKIIPSGYKVLCWK